MDKQTFEKICSRIDSYTDYVIELQKKLISTPAIGPESGGDGELDKSKILEPIINSLYDKVEIIKAPDNRVSCGYRPNIIATKEGNSANKTIWLMSHMDVVPAGDESMWETPPFEAVVKDGKIYGRGSEDNNQGIISTILAMKALSEKNITPTFKIGGLFVADEEVSDAFGAAYIMKHHHQIFDKNDLIIVPDIGNAKGDEIEIAEKTSIWIKVITKGKQAHGGYPYKGINAYKAAAHLICKMENLSNKYSEQDSIYDPPMNTFEPTMKLSNVPNINTIPGEDVTCFDCRLLPTIKYEDFIKTIESYFKEIENEFKVKITYEIPDKSIAAPPTPIDSPTVTALTKAIKTVHNVQAKPVGSGAGTVAGNFRKRGLHTAVYSKMANTYHEPNEHCPIENILGDAKVWAHVFLQE